MKTIVGLIKSVLKQQQEEALELKVVTRFYQKKMFTVFLQFPEGVLAFLPMHHLPLKHRCLPP